MPCIRCGDCNAPHYVRLDTVGVICVACLILEVHEMREKVADLEAELEAADLVRRATH